MKTALVFLALFVLGFFPVMLVLSVWNDDPEPAPQILSPEEQARRDTEMENFLLNRDGCELARHQVERALRRVHGKARMGLERLRVRLDRRFGGVRAAWPSPSPPRSSPSLPAAIAPPPASSSGPPDPAAGSLSTWTGALLMQSSLKIGLAAGVLAIAGVSWMVLDGGPAAAGSERGVLEAPPAAVADEPAAAPELASTDDLDRAPIRRATSETAPTAEPVVEEIASSARRSTPPPTWSPTSPTRSAHRCPACALRSSPTRTPWAGAPHRARRAASTAGSESGYPWSPPWANHVLVYDAEGFGRGAVGCYLEAGETNHLGAIELAPDGVVTGASWTRTADRGRRLGLVTPGPLARAEPGTHGAPGPTGR